MKEACEVDRGIQIKVQFGVSFSPVFAKRSCSLLFQNYKCYGIAKNDQKPRKLSAKSQLLPYKIPKVE